jgi:hypothetical protein
MGLCTPKRVSLYSMLVGEMYTINVVMLPLSRVGRRQGDSDRCLN